MSHPNTDRDERVYPDPKKVEAGRAGGLKRQENWRKGVKECEWCGRLSADLNDHPCFIAAESAATAMRDRCVAKVREMRDDWLAREKNHLDAHGTCASSNALREHYSAASQIITALSSLTLDQVEQEKPK